MSSNNTAKTKAERREAARAEALELRAAQERKDKRNRAITLGALIVGIAALFALIAFIMMNSSSGAGSQEPFVAKSPKPITDVVVPTNATQSGGFSVGETGVVGTQNQGAVQVDVYLDFMCPLCGQFEEMNAETLDELRTSGAATVVYHPISILDGASKGTGFSSRSAAAAAYVAANAPESFMAFSTAMFDNQPAEGTPGLTDKKMASLAEDAGVPADIAAKIGDGTATSTYGEWVTAQTAADGTNPDLRGSSGQFGTPTITINGARWDGNWSQPGALADAVAQAAAK